MRLPGRAVLFLTCFFYAFGSRPCSEHCQKVDNPTLSTCTPDTGECSQGCLSGYYGDMCNISCDVNCLGKTCQQRGGTCTCTRGYTFNINSCERNEGVNCKRNENCLLNACTSESRDECLFGCKPGWFGGSCEQNCSEHCVCHQTSGTCVSCEAGWYGDNCKSPCNKECAGSSTDCERDGTCRQGCNRGFYGDRCKLSCPRECKDNLCRSNGSCYACKTGFYGEFCHQKCTGCSKGVCDQTTSACTEGCVIGFYGTSCALRCKGCEGNCNMNTGDCVLEANERDQWMEVQSWIGGGAAVVIVSIIAAVLICKCRRLKRIHGVKYNVVKLRRRPPQGNGNGHTVASGYTGVDDEARIIQPRVYPFSRARPSSYIEPRHSGGTVPTQQDMLSAGVSDLAQAVAAPTSNRLVNDDLGCSGRPDSYTLPHYCEVNEELMTTLPQPTQGDIASAAVVTKALFSVVADVHVTEGDISIPLIAECFGPTETDNSSSYKDTQPYVENYDHLVNDGKSRIGRATSYTQVNDEARIILPGVHPISSARSACYIEPRHSGETVPSKQHILTARMSDKQEDEPQDPASPPSDSLLQHLMMTTLSQTPRGAEAPAALVKSPSFSPIADVKITGGDISIPLIAECFGPNETDESSRDEDSPPLVENYDHIFRDNYMEH